MYTGTFTFMPADKNWIYDPTKNPYHNCPANHQFEVNLVGDSNFLKQNLPMTIQQML